VNTLHAARAGPPRCGKRFGDEAYAFEELVAELGSAFLSADLGIATELHHADYLSSRVKILKCDKQAIFMAAARASYAAEYLKRRASPESLPEVPFERMMEQRFGDPVGLVRGAR
jgi:antirestriction protein ArdC